MSNVIHAKEAEFNELIQKEELVLVDFFATWCGPCKMLAPEIEKLADEFKGKAKIVKGGCRSGAGTGDALRGAVHSNADRIQKRRTG